MFIQREKQNLQKETILKRVSSISIWTRVEKEADWMCNEIGIFVVEIGQQQLKCNRFAPLKHRSENRLRMLHR